MRLEQDILFLFQKLNWKTDDIFTYILFIYGFSLYVLFACKVRIVLQIYDSLGETAARQKSLSLKDVILSIQIEFCHIIHECDCLRTYTLPFSWKVG